LAVNTQRDDSVFNLDDFDAQMMDVADQCPDDEN
jgi:hypothetical protein